jgi:hypothetical protein
MTDTTTIKTSFERNRNAVSLRPSVGVATVVTKVKLIDGCACEITDGQWTLKADLPATEGGIRHQAVHYCSQSFSEHHN